MPPPVHVANIFILLLSIATGVTLVARLARVPYTVALVVAGLAIGASHVVAVPHLTKDLVFAVFLPGLLFEAAFHLRWTQVRHDAAAISTLAIPGVGVSLVLTAVLMVLVSRLAGLGDSFGWRQGFVFGALIAATDPVAVVALFRSLGAPQRLTTLIEAESLLNDGTAIVFLGMVLTATAGVAPSLPSLVLDFVRIVGTGVLVGGALGAMASQVSRRIDDPMVEITMTAMAAYGSFALTDQLGGSGVIATVVAGLICGNAGSMSATTRATAESFWEYIAFLLNSMVFLLIGFEVQLGELKTALPFILVAFVAGLIARITVVGGVTLGVSFTEGRLPQSWIAPLTWGGLRGALSMVLALSLPADFPQRALLVSTTFGVVILSIVLQGITMSPLMHHAGLVRRRPSGRGHEHKAVSTS